MAFGFDPWATCSIHDLGDVPLPEANDNERSFKRITDFLNRLSDMGLTVFYPGMSMFTHGGGGVNCRAQALCRKKVDL